MLCRRKPAEIFLSSLCSQRIKNILSSNFPFPHSSHYPSHQHQQVFTGNTPARQTGKLTEYLSHSLLSSTSNPLVSFLAHWHQPFYLPRLPASHISCKSHRLCPPNLLLYTRHFIPALTLADFSYQPTGHGYQKTR